MSVQPAPIVRTFMTHEMRDADIAALATGRGEEFSRILDAIQRSRRAAPGTLQHVVLYGSRGFGKSFMTRRVQIATSGMAGDEGRVHYVLLAEEQHNLQRNPHEFLDLIAAHLRQARGAAGDADAAFRETMFQWPKPGEEGRRWDEAAAKLEAEIDACLAGERGLVIAVVENFDSLLATLFKGEEEEQRLRHWLDRSQNRLMLFATATGTVDIHYDRPLFQAFESIRLSPWTPDNCVEYFNRLRRLEGRHQLSAAEEAKARAIAEFIGGTPRLAQLLAEVIDTQEALTVADTMSALADRLAEYYRRRIDDLPQLARGLLDALIRGGEPASQTALAERVGAGGQNIIARTMADLERADVIRGQRARDSREKLYSVTDRVFVHYYRLRQGSLVARHTPLATILDFLRSFYSRDEQLHQALRYLEAGRPAEAGLFSRLANEGLERPTNEYLDRFRSRFKLYVNDLPEEGRARALSWIKDLSNQPEDSYHRCKQDKLSGSISGALSASVQAQALERMNLTVAAKDLLEKASESHDSDSYAIINTELYLYLRDVARDLECSDRTILDIKRISSIRSRSIKAQAVLLVAPYLRSSGKSKEAVEVVQSILPICDFSDDPQTEIQLLLELVLGLAEIDLNVEALEASRRVNALADQLGNTTVMAASLSQTSILQSRLGFHAESLETAKQSLNMLENSEKIHLRAHMQSSLAQSLYHNGQTAEADASFAEALNLARDANDPELQRQIMHQRASFLITIERFDEAADLALDAMRLLDVDSGLDDQHEILSSLTRALSKTKRHEEAIEYGVKLVQLSEKLGRTRDVATAGLQLAGSYAEVENYEMSWNVLDQTVSLVRTNEFVDLLLPLLVVGAVVGAPLGKPEAVQYLLEALDILKDKPAEDIAELVWANPLFTGMALTNDFDRLDSLLAEHGDWLAANSSGIFFTRLDGQAIGLKAAAQGRAGGYALMANLLPRIANFMKSLSPEKRDASWLSDLISGFAETCRDPGLLRDVAGLLTESLAPAAASSGEMLRHLADVDESPEPESILARLNPDIVTLIRRLRGLPNSETEPKKKRGRIRR